jgi:diguanylate cyclase (GGDEF)-like protein
MELLQGKTAVHLVLLLTILSVVIILVVTYFIGKFRGRQQLQNEQRRASNKSLSPEKLANYKTTSRLNAKINKLSELNNRYLKFTQHLSDVVRHLYSSLDSEKTSAIIISLVKDLIDTDTVELYHYDRQDNLLKKMDPHIKKMVEPITYALGEGLVGSAAQDNIIKIKGVTYAETNLSDYGKDTEKFWMVSPINFKNRLIGVLGIGRIKHPNGNESKLLKLICDIAGVTMANQRYLKEWKHGSIKDPLTGLYNRRYFSHMSVKYLEKSIMNDFPISICLFDIDHFKNYNDTNGHQEGDRLLREVSDLLTRMTRKGSIVARYGGEEFIVLLPDITKDEAFIYAERVKQEIAGHPFLRREKQPLGCVSVSGGVATFPDDANSMEKVIELADKNLYKAKSEGRNQVIKNDQSDASLKGECQVLVLENLK